MVKRSFNYGYLDGEIMEVTKTTYVGDGTNIITPKKVMSTIQDYVKFTKKGQSEISYEYRQRDIVKSTFGKIIRAGSVTIKYSPSTYLRIERDTLGRINYKAITTYNSDSTILMTYEYQMNLDFTDGDSTVTTNSFKYDNNKKLILIKRVSSVKGKIKESSDIDPIARTEKRFDDVGTLFFEKRTNSNGRTDEFRIVNKETGQWTEWKDMQYCTVN